MILEEICVFMCLCVCVFVCVCDVENVIIECKVNDAINVFCRMIRKEQ